MSLDLSAALPLVTSLAVEAGVLLRNEFHRPEGPRRIDAHHAPVDVEVEALLRRRLLEAFPGCGYVGEETGPDVHGSNGHTWFVDPNDGTQAFLEGWRGSSLSIGLVGPNGPVLGVVYAPEAPDDRGDLITWAVGEPLRRNGQVVERAPLSETLQPLDVVLVSQHADHNPRANADACAPARFRAVPSIAYRLALVAVGEGEAAVSLNSPGPLDYAAGHALLRAAGGDLFNGAGLPVRYDDRRTGHRIVLGAHPQVAAKLAPRNWERVFERHEEQVELVRPDPLRNVRGDVLARAQGALLGQLAGDSLGSLVEFQTAAAIRGRYPDGVRALADGGTWNTLAGQPTDDSEMALALARTLVEDGHYDAEHVLDAYREWLDSDPFDLGRTTSNALRGRLDAHSQANGSLMRVSPLAVFAHAKTPDEIAALARADSALTHPHRACQDAVAAYSVALAFAVRTGQGPREVYDETMRWVRSASLEPSVTTALKQAKDGAPADFMTHQGWVLIALQNAFYRLLHAPSFEEAVVATVGEGGDTDTNAAIVGALAGAVYGRDAVPLQWRRAITSCRPLASARTRPMRYWPVDALELAEALASGR